MGMGYESVRLMDVEVFELNVDILKPHFEFLFLIRNRSSEMEIEPPVPHSYGPVCPNCMSTGAAIEKQCIRAVESIGFIDPINVREMAGNISDYLADNFVFDLAAASYPPWVVVVMAIDRSLRNRHDRQVYSADLNGPSWRIDEYKDEILPMLLPPCEEDEIDEHPNELNGQADEMDKQEDEIDEQRDEIGDEHEDEIGDEDDDEGVGWVLSRVPPLKVFERGDCAGSCAICLEDSTEEEEMNGRKLPCDHIFHGRCLASWLWRSNSCPICRSQLIN